MRDQGHTWKAGLPAATIAADVAEADLIRRGVAGDQLAYAALYRRYAPMLYRLTYTLLQNQEDAEEVLQDAFEYAFRRLARYDSRKASFKTWIYQIALSRSRNKRRRKRLLTTPISTWTEEGPDLADTRRPAPDDVVALGETQQRVWEAIGSLSPKLREVAVLRYYGGLKYGEIGVILGIKAKTAESRMRLAHQALRQTLADVV